MIIEPEILKELPHFEMFFHRIGFKRIDGAVYGLLVLSDRPLTSPEIEQTLNLSQSAVSLSLKTLTHFGAIESRDQRDSSKAKVHTAKEDSLSIVASVFRKREEEYIEDFKLMARRVLEKSKSSEHEARKRRMQSIITTCEIAEAVMNFVITLVQNKTKEAMDQSGHYEAIVKRLPKALDFLANTAMPITDLSLHIKDNLTERFKNNLKGFLE